MQFSPLLLDAGCMRKFFKSFNFDNFSMFVSQVADRSWLTCLINLGFAHCALVFLFCCFVYNLFQYDSFAIKIFLT